MAPPATPTSSPSPPVALSIAGFDPSSGAGITADLLVFQAHGLFGTSAITALTVQSTTGVKAVHPVSGALLLHALETLHADLPPRGIKIGMLGNADIVESIANYLEDRAPQQGINSKIPIVLDPILRSSSGAALLDPSAFETLRDRLLPLVDWITPNWSELATLAAQTVTSVPQAEHAARLLQVTYPSLGVIVTGGDQHPPTDLVFPPNRASHSLPGEHIETTSTHGTGCAFSTAFLSNLIHRKPALDAARNAKTYVAEALRYAPGLGRGRGPLNLLWPLR